MDITTNQWQRRHVRVDHVGTVAAVLARATAVREVSRAGDEAASFFLMKVRFVQRIPR